MPASEKTWRKLPLLHLVFGISSVAMLLSTLWMLAADHNREWKPYQENYRRIQRVVLERRILEAQTVQYTNELREARAELAQALTEPPAAETVAAFRAELIVHSLFQPTGKVETPKEYLASLNQHVAETFKQLGVEAEVDRRAVFARLKQADTAYLEALIAGKTVPEQPFADKLRDRISSSAGKVATEYAELATALGAYGSNLSDEQIEDIRAVRAGFRAELENIFRPVNDAFNLSSRNLKFERAERDAANSAFQLAITGGSPQAEIDRLEGELRKIEDRISMMDLRVQEIKVHRETLQAALRDLDGAVAKTEKQVAALEENINGLLEALASQRPNRLLEYPIVDAFNSPIKIQQIWCPDLKINYNLAWVARFDRCITCHQGIDKTMPGSAVDPMLVPRTNNALAITLPTPRKRPIPDYNAARESELSLSKESLELRATYGMDLADEGLLDPNEVTIAVVWGAESARHNGFPVAAVMSGLQSGDVIQAINGTKITSRDQAIRYLIEDVVWGKPLQLKILRGIQHPYATHPRLDLYLGSFSPHPTLEYGCTVCHDGQGSATAFTWASHSPNNPAQRVDWENEYGWFSNHHWPFHMRPQRFVESNCIKCHHEVTELNASERFPEPPAPKVTRGHQLIRRYGCFGCHEINGYDGPNRIGPDMRSEPLYFAAAQQLLADPWFQRTGEDGRRAKLTELAHEVIRYPENTDARKRLGEWIEADAHAETQHLAPASHRMAEILVEDNETPGKLRRPGPSLRYLKSKVGAEFLYDWIKDPQHFRPSTRMPKFFGLHNHLAGPPALTAASVNDWSAVAEALASARTDDEPAGRIWEMLPENQRPLVSVAGQADSPKTQRARRTIAAALTEMYSSRELYEPAAFSSLAVAGDLGYFFRTAEGGTVLKRPVAALSDRETEWLNRLLIESAFPGQIKQDARQGESQLDKAYRYETVEVLGTVQYLLAASQPFEFDPLPSEPGTVERGRDAFQTRGCLACHSINDPEAQVKGKADQGPDLSHLGAKFRGEQGKQWLYTWVRDPNRYHARTVMPDLYLEPIENKDQDGKVTSVTDPAADIVAYLLSFDDWKPYPVPKLNQDDATDMQALDDVVLMYLEKSYPKRQATRYAHEGIPADSGVAGDEAELVEPISIEKKLRYVGRKSIARLGCFGCHDIPGYETAKPIGTGLNAWGEKLTAQLAFEQIGTYLGTGHGHGGGDHHAQAAVPASDAPGADGEPDTDYEYFLESLSHHHREGFIWQKLRAPRSYDYKMTGHKGYDERLRMPRFPFNYEEREAVITFVLGLVADPPQAKGAQYIYQPNRRNESIQAGQRVMEKYNCKGCHMFEPERWLYEYDPDVVAANNAPDSGSLYKVAGVPEKEDFEVLHPYFSPKALSRSTVTDRRGLAQVEIAGRKQTQEVEDEDGNVYYYYDLWKPTVIAGMVFRPTQQIPIRNSQLVPDQHRPPDGGELARLLHPYVLAKAKQANPNAKDDDAWALLPPPLMGEGAKVQTEWLYRFLLDPSRIRPAVVLRMPKFNMSTVEARQLVNYFAALDDVEYPYGDLPERDPDYLQRKYTQYPEYFNNAFKIVANAEKGCTQCHYVGDFAPKGNTIYGPNLANVHERIRPEFLTRWLSRPKELLPYTGMPANFPNEAPDKLAFQDEFKAPPTEQIRAVRDLLLNFDRFDRKSVKDQVKLPPAKPAAGDAGGEGGR